MKEIHLTRKFLRRPINSVLILLSIYLLLEGVAWSVAPSLKLTQVDKVGGFFRYIGSAFAQMLLPELCTLSIVVVLINRLHDWLHLNAVDNNWRAVGRYQLRFLPVFVFAFWVFDPVTQTVRYLLEQLPIVDGPHNPSLAEYWQGYILHTYNFNYYFKYLLPVLLIGYIALNISLLTDFLQQRRQAQEEAEAKATEASQKALALSAVFSPKPTTSSTHLAHLKGKSALGELDFPVNDAYFFTIEDRFYYAELAKGRYLVVKTLNELETELDPTQFFRIKRDYIVNRQAVLNYAYWENGKYIVRLNSPDRHEIIVPRARMQVFREWLQGNQRPYADTDQTDPDSLVMAS